MGISLRAAISGVKRLFGQLIWPIVDAIFIGMAIKGFSFLWASYYFEDPTYYSGSSLDWNIVWYAGVWSFVLWFIGYYQKSSWRKRWVGVISGLVCILIAYALLPDQYRSSRVIILAGTLISLIATAMTSMMFRNNGHSEKTKNILIVSDSLVAEEIKAALKKAEVKSNILGIVNPLEGEPHDLNYLNDISQLGPLCKVLKADEIIFSTESLGMKEIMRQMMILDTKLSFKIAGDDSLSIIGSDSKNTSGELYNVNINYNLADGYYKHIKRIFDFSMSIVLLLLTPVLLIFNNFRILGLLKHIFQTMFGFTSLVGYAGRLDEYQNLPELKPGVIKLPIGDKEDRQVRNMYYARDYSVWTDLEVLIKNLKRLT
jgi:hypothetical protein